MTDVISSLPSVSWW